MDVVLKVGLESTSVFKPKAREEEVATPSSSPPAAKRIIDRGSEKYCIKCKQVRKKEEFGKNKDQPDGLQSYCKFCKAELGKRRRERNVRARLRHHISTRVADQLGNLCPSGLTRDLEKYLGYRMSVLVEALSADLKRRYPDKKLRDVLQEGWHIDHIYPLSRFKVIKGGEVDWEEFRRCWHPTNLTAIPAEDNLRKGARVQNEKPV